MSCYPCENFQLFILYNFLFRHMVWKRFPTALNSYSIFMRKGGKSRKSNFGNEKLFRMSSYTCEDFQDEIPDILSHDQKHHFHFGRKKQDVWESFFLVGPIFNQKRPFLFEVDFFLVRLIFDEKRPFFSWWEFSLTKKGFFVCWLFSWWNISLTKTAFFVWSWVFSWWDLSSTKKGLFCLKLTFFLGETYL